MNNLTIARAKLAIRARMAEKRQRIAEILTGTADLRLERDRLVAEHVELGNRITELQSRIDAVEQPALHDLKMALAEDARADTALRVDAETLEQAKAETEAGDAQS